MLKLLIASFFVTPLITLADISQDKKIIHFDFNKSIVMSSEASVFHHAVLDYSNILKLNPTWVLRVEGHTDEIGTDAQNKILAKRRIAELSSALIKAGVSSKQILEVPYGEVNTLVDGHSDSAWAANRRIVISIIK